MSFDADDLFEDAATKLQASLAAHGVGGEKSAYIAVAVVDDLRKHWGGQAFYVPQGIGVKRRKRDLAILSEFNGKNYGELAMNHGISEMRVRQILWKMTKPAQDKAQEEARLAAIAKRRKG
jgi:Mor family transcriptional regulator